MVRVYDDDKISDQAINTTQTNLEVLAISNLTETAVNNTRAVIKREIMSATNTLYSLDRIQNQIQRILRYREEVNEMFIEIKAELRYELLTQRDVIDGYITRVGTTRSNKLLMFQLKRLNTWITKADTLELIDRNLCQHLSDSPNSDGEDPDELRVSTSIYREGLIGVKNVTEFAFKRADQRLKWLISNTTDALTRLQALEAQVLDHKLSLKGSKEAILRAIQELKSVLMDQKYSLVAGFDSNDSDVYRKELMTLSVLLSRLDVMEFLALDWRLDWDPRVVGYCADGEGVMGVTKVGNDAKNVIKT